MRKFSLCKLNKTSMSSKRDLYDDSDGAHLTSFGIEFRKKKKQKKTSDRQVMHYCVQVY